MTRSVGRFSSVIRLCLLTARNHEQTVTATVVGLLRYATFHDLFSHNDPRKFGSESVEWLEDQINEFYSPEDQYLYGGNWY